MKNQQTRPAGTRGYTYIRTSKEVQNKVSQEEAVQKWLDARGLTVIETVADSGSRDLSYKRSGFQYLLQLIQNKKVDWVVVAERDRWGVSDNEEWGYYVTILRQNNCQLWSVADDKELTSRKDRVEPFMAAITSDRSRSEQEARGQREHRSKHSLVQKGAWPGGKAPWGYDLLCVDQHGRELWRLVHEQGQHRRRCEYPDGSVQRFDGKDNVPARNKGEVLVLAKTRDAVLESWVLKVFEWFRDGHSYRAIATQLNALKVPAAYKGYWLGPTVKGILRNPVYATGVPTWNKQAHGRFIEYVNGEWMPVERDGGRVKAGRKRSAEDHISAPPKPSEAIIAADLWNAVQARIRALEAAPKTERRPRNPDLYLSGLLVCADCGERMAGWAQHNAYRCSRNMHNPRECRLNKTRHDVIEEILCQYLGECEETLALLHDHPDHCGEVWELDRQSEPLIAEYTRRVTALWRQAKEAGVVAPEGKDGLRVWTYEKLRSLGRESQEKAAEGLREAIEAKEAEKGRLAKRMGLVDDEEAAAAIAERLRQVTAELKDLRERAKPVTDEVDALRVQLRSLLGQVRRTRDVMATALPLKKGEAVRKVVCQIRVVHELRMMGKLRASRLVGVEIIPAVGEPVRLPAPADFIGEASRGRG